MEENRNLEGYNGVRPQILHSLLSDSSTSCLFSLPSSFTKALSIPHLFLRMELSLIRLGLKGVYLEKK